MRYSSAMPIASRRHRHSGGARASQTAAAMKVGIAHAASPNDQVSFGLQYWL